MLPLAPKKDDIGETNAPKKDKTLEVKHPPQE